MQSSVVLPVIAVAGPGREELAHLLTANARVRWLDDAGDVTRVLDGDIEDPGHDVIAVAVTPGQLDGAALVQLIERSAGVVLLHDNPLSSWAWTAAASTPGGGSAVTWDAAGFAAWAGTALALSRDAERIARAGRKPFLAMDANGLRMISDAVAFWAALTEVVPGLAPARIDSEWRPWPGESAFVPPLGQLADPRAALLDLGTFGLDWLATGSTSHQEGDLIAAVTALGEACRADGLDAIVAERAALLEWRDALIGERDALITERDALLRRRAMEMRDLQAAATGRPHAARSPAERALLAERNEARAALQAVEASSVWRYSRPLRQLRASLRRKAPGG